MKKSKSISSKFIEVSVIMPCLNEEATLGICIKKAQNSMQSSGIIGEILIADNGSYDQSVSIAKSLGVKVLIEPKNGYG